METETRYIGTLRRRLKSEMQCFFLLIQTIIFATGIRKMYHSVKYFPILATCSFAVSFFFVLVKTVVQINVHFL